MALLSHTLQYPTDENLKDDVTLKTTKENYSSEYLLLIASKQKINQGKDIDFDNMKKLLYDIPTSNWTKQRISYTVVK